jgi:membrane fusion protein (multidrug efflux system)
VSSPPPAPPQATGNGRNARRRGLLLLAAVVLLGAAAWTIYWFGYGRWHESTEDAYVGGNIVQITTEIAGSVRAVAARETESVNAGQTLLELDPADARVAMDAALADLASTVRQVAGSFAQVERLQAEVGLREVELERARADFARRNSLAGTGAVSEEDLAHARDSIAGLEAALRAANEELNVARSQTAGTTTEDHPLVLRAVARVRETALTLARTRVVAPVSGVIGKKGVYVGQRVAPGTPLMGLVPLDDVWVDANFKEVQLEHMRIGQPVELRADLYGRSVRFDGRVIGLSPGTGAAFALLPPQNASGNWIKIVQRVPVRIALEPAQVHEHPLRVGLSMHVVVDLHDQSGPVLTPPRTEAAVSIPPRPERDPTVEAMIARIIATNSGHTAPRG